MATNWLSSWPPVMFVGTSRAVGLAELPRMLEGVSGMIGDDLSEFAFAIDDPASIFLIPMLAVLRPWRMSTRATLTTAPEVCEKAPAPSQAIIAIDSSDRMRRRKLS